MNIHKLPETHEKLLIEQTTKCKVNNKLSKPQIINYGVPRGSTLGPLFFIIFINAIADFINNVKIPLYANDTAFYLSGPNKNTITNELPNAASEFSLW